MFSIEYSKLQLPEFSVLVLWCGNRHHFFGRSCWKLSQYSGAKYKGEICFWIFVSAAYHKHCIKERIMFVTIKLPMCIGIKLVFPTAKFSDHVLSVPPLTSIPLPGRPSVCILQPADEPPSPPYSLPLLQTVLPHSRVCLSCGSGCQYFPHNQSYY